MDNVRDVVASVNWSDPAPFGALSALLPYSVNHRRLTITVLAALLATGPWFLSAWLGVAGLGAALAVTVHAGRTGKKATQDERAIIAALLPPCTVLAACEWATPGFTGPLSPMFRQPAAAIAAIAVAGTGIWLLGRRLQGPTDPQRHFAPTHRREVTARDGNWCSYCGAHGTDRGVQLNMDHVIAWANGGRTIVSNAQLLCGPCNSLKASLNDNEARRRFRQTHGYNAGTRNPSRGLLARLTPR